MHGQPQIAKNLTRTHGTQPVYLVTLDLSKVMANGNAIDRLDKQRKRIGQGAVEIEDCEFDCHGVDYAFNQAMPRSMDSWASRSIRSPCAITTRSNGHSSRRSIQARAAC